MAYYRKTKAGWRVEIERRGVRQSRTFATKAAASAWATQQERSILDGEVARWPAKTVRQAVDRYVSEVTPTKGTARNETLRLAAFVRDYPALADKLLHEVAPSDVAAWRDSELRRVTAGTVKRLANHLRGIWTTAEKEWGWCGPSPWKSVKMPADNPARDRLAGWREIRRVLRRCDYVTHYPPVSGLQNVAWAFLVGLRTGMRASEILGLSVADISGPVVTIQKHKTQHLTGKPRRVPLTPQGARLVAQLVAHAQAMGRPQLLTITSRSLDAQFRAVTGSLLIDDLHFHDSRGTALTHLARKVDAMTLARISGHRDLRVLLRTYYRETPEQIAGRLALPSGQRRQRPIAASSE